MLDPDIPTFSKHVVCFIVLYKGLYLRTGQRGPGPGRQISRGGILKKIEIEVWYAGEKGCQRERNLTEIYIENTMFCLLSVLCVIFAYT
jgi:hypothetical protein